MTTVFTIGSMCFPSETLIDTYEGKKMIKDLVRGELILTKSGYKHLSKVIVSEMENGKYHYVKIPKNKFGSVPEEDLYIYISEEHAFSLGFRDFKADNKSRKLIDPGTSYLLLARYFKNNFDDIELVVLDISSCFSNATENFS